MQKKIVIWLCVLALLTTFTGCSKKNNKDGQNNSVTETAQGEQMNADGSGSSDVVTVADNYTEREIPQIEMAEKEYRIGERINSNNQVEIYTVQDSEDKKSSIVNCYTMDGDTFSKSTVEWASKASKDLDISPEVLCQSEDGNEYMQFVKTTVRDDGNYSSRIILKKTEDEKGYEDVTPSYWSDTDSKIQYCEGPFISSLKITKNQIMCFQEDAEAELIFYDMKEKKLVDHGGIATYWQYALKENTIYTFTDDLNKVMIYNLENDEKETIDLMRTSSGVFQRIIQLGPNNEIFVMDADGLHVCLTNEKEWKTIIYGEKCNMSTPTFRAESLTILPGSVLSFFVIYNSSDQGMKGIFDKYEPVAGTQKKEGSEDDTKKITICSLFDNPTIRMGITNFRKLHPDVDVTYNLLWDLDSTDSTATRAEIIRSLNVELLAGKGADILVLDYLPVSSFEEKGILLDLSDIFHSEDKEGLVLDSISGSYNKDGKTYCMPVKFLLPYYAMRDDISTNTDTVEALADYCKDKDKKIIATSTYKRLLEEFIQLYPNEIFAEDNTIKKDGLTSFLSSMNTIATQIGAVSGTEEDQYSTGNDEDQYQTLPDSLLTQDATIMVKSYMASLSELERTIAILNEMKGTYAPVNHTFIPYGIIGVNSATKNPELAKEFVACLFDESIQSLDLQDGFPVNKESLMKLNIPCREIGSTVYLTSTNEYKMINIESLTEDDMKKFQKYVNSLTTIAYMDEDCRGIIATGGTEYLEGKITLEQAVDNIIQKYKLYSDE